MNEMRVGLVGLGSMGRHHARLLGSLPGVDFVGATDPRGDRHRALRGTPLFEAVADLIVAGIDAAVVATPTAHHEAVALELCDAGVATMIEKPLADTVEAAIRIRDRFAEKGVLGAVGHVERFNPALMELKQRLEQRVLGKVFSIATERVGPFPDRIEDVGVIKDLATHDIDIITWVSGSDVEAVAAQAMHKMGREHEDLVSVVGRLGDGTVFNLQVNWLTPMKRRSVTVLGEKGALVADLIGADLFHYANASIPSDWDEMARLRGVSEGDMVRYAIHKPEPIRSELEAFLAAVRGEGDRIVSLDQGVRVIQIAEAVARSAVVGSMVPVP